MHELARTIECESKYELTRTHPRRHLPQVRDLSRLETYLLLTKLYHLRMRLFRIDVGNLHHVSKSLASQLKGDPLRTPSLINKDTQSSVLIRTAFGISATFIHRSFCIKSPLHSFKMPSNGPQKLTVGVVWLLVTF